MTASFGTTVATGRDLTDVAAVLRSAEGALHEAKAAGRNRVESSGLVGPSTALASSG